MCQNNRNGYWLLWEEAPIVHTLYRLLTHPNVKVRWQNGLYDAQYIYRYWHFLPRGAQDTMISQHTAFVSQPKSLAFQSSMYSPHYVSRKETQEYVFLNVNPEFTRHPVLRRSMEAFFTMFYQGLRDLGAVEMVQQSEIVKIFVKEEEPSYAELLREFFHDNISWGNYANQIRIAKSILDVKVPNANPITASATRKILQSQLAQLKASKGGLNELRSLFDLGCYKQDECAKQMLTTLPTLKRFLKLAYTTFSDELKLS